MPVLGGGCGAGAGQEHDTVYDPTAAGSGQHEGQQDSWWQKGGRQAGQGAAPQVVAVFGLSPFVVVFLALLAPLFFCCQDGGDKHDEAGSDGHGSGEQDSWW